MRRKLTELAGPRLLARYPFVLSLNALLAVLLFTFVLRSARVDAQNNTPPARLGEIVSSMRSEAQFQTVYGSGWAIFVCE